MPVIGHAGRVSDIPAVLAWQCRTSAAAAAIVAAQCIPTIGARNTQ
jgi:hypothetical protein